jgi:hypothetical protein
MRGRLWKRLLVAGVPVLLALAAAGGSWAYFSTSGSGSGAAHAATAQAVTLEPAVPTAELYPGATADVRLKVTNPNPIAIRIGSLQLDTSQGNGGFAVDNAHSACAVSALSFTDQTNGGSGWQLPPRVGTTDGTLDIDLPDAISMSMGAADSCQGAHFTVYLKAGS